MFGMSDSGKLTLQLEIVWWIFTLLVVLGVMYPILSNVPEYPFTFSNVLYIVVFITITRHIFLLKHSFLANAQWAKAIILLVTVPFVFYLVTELHHFQTYLDDYSADAFLGNLSEPLRTELESYIRNEMILFGTGSIIAACILPFRLIISLWRWKNGGNV